MQQSFSSIQMLSHERLRDLHADAVMVRGILKHHKHRSDGKRSAGRLRTLLGAALVRTGRSLQPPLSSVIEIAEIP